MTWYNLSKYGVLTINDGCETIPNGFFRNREDIKEVIIPNSVRNIRGKAFYLCSKITKITIPKKEEKRENIIL